MNDGRYAIALALVAGCAFDTSVTALLSDGGDAPPDASPPCENANAADVGITFGNINDSEPAITLVEGGGSVDYTIALNAEPCSDVGVTLESDEDIVLQETTLNFTPENWDQPQTVSVTATHDFVQENLHNSDIQHTAASADTAYQNLTVPPVSVEIQDRAHVALVSVSSTGESANRNCEEPTVSDSGNSVAFTTQADNLVPNDAGGRVDVFLRNLDSNTTLRISEGAQEGNGNSRSPRIAANGQSIAFFSRARNLTSDANTNAGEVFRYDANTATLTQVSDLCTSACNNEIGASTIAISSAGEAVAYSTRRRLVSDTDSEYDIFLDLPNQLESQASLNSKGENATNFLGSNAFDEGLSASGRYVTFRAAAHNLGQPEITNQNFHAYVKDTTSGLLTRVSVHHGGVDNCEGPAQSAHSGAPQVSADGNIAVFDTDCVFNLSTGIDDSGARDIMLRNIAAQTTTRLSVAVNGTAADGDSFVLAISDDGNLVTFVSEATNLVSGDNNGSLDAFMHDVAAGTTRRVSYDTRYDELPSGISDASVSRNGRFVVFSTSDTLTEDDTNSTLSDIYRVQLY